MMKTRKTKDMKRRKGKRRYTIRKRRQKERQTDIHQKKRRNARKRASNSIIIIILDSENTVSATKNGAPHHVQKVTREGDKEGRTGNEESVKAHRCFSLFSLSFCFDFVHLDSTRVACFSDTKSIANVVRRVIRWSDWLTLKRN